MGAKTSTERRHTHWHWHSLPAHLLATIYDHCPVGDVVSAIRACRHWRLPFHSDLVWRSRVQRDFPRSSIGGDRAHLSFRERYRLLYCTERNWRRGCVPSCEIVLTTARSFRHVAIDDDWLAMLNYDAQSASAQYRLMVRAHREPHPEWTLTMSSSLQAQADQQVHSLHLASVLQLLVVVLARSVLVFSARDWSAPARVLGPTSARIIDAGVCDSNLLTVDEDGNLHRWDLEQCSFVSLLKGAASRRAALLRGGRVRMLDTPRTDAEPQWLVDRHEYYDGFGIHSYCDIVYESTPQGFARRRSTLRLDGPSVQRRDARSLVVLEDEDLAWVYDTEQRRYSAGVRLHTPTLTEAWHKHLCMMGSPEGIAGKRQLYAATRR
jgi:hypothetical protein